MGYNGWRIVHDLNDTSLEEESGQQRLTLYQRASDPLPDSQSLPPEAKKCYAVEAAAYWTCAQLSPASRLHCV